MQSLWSRRDQFHLNAAIVSSPELVVWYMVVSSSGYETNNQKLLEMHEIELLQPFQVHIR